MTSTWVGSDGKTLRDLLRSIKVGCWIELVSGQLILVGDINGHGGVCDDCTHPEMETPTKRYMQVHAPETVTQ